jgi:hypothetical protein
LRPAALHRCRSIQRGRPPWRRTDVVHPHPASARGNLITPLVGWAQKACGLPDCRTPVDTRVRPFLSRGRRLSHRPEDPNAGPASSAIPRPGSCPASTKPCPTG